ncbi:rhodanese domain-containing protein CG4456 [Cochliomyia hominivorax]
MKKFIILCFVICSIFQIIVAEEENADFATYEEVKDIPNNPNKYLIEVRSKELVEKDGSIPGSINIPFAELEEALMMSDEDFVAKYGAEKPPKDAVVIFTCLGGQYAQMGADLAKKNGWKNAKPYLGSWMEWSKREGLN